MEHLSFASYLAEDLRMNETWTWTGNSRVLTHKHNTAFPVHYQGTYEGVMPFKIGTIHSTAHMGVQALCYKGDLAKLQRRGGQALKDDSKFSSKGSGGRVFLVHPGDRTPRPGDWKPQVSLQDRKVAIGPWGADSKWRDAQGSLLVMRFDEHLVVLCACVLSCVWLLATPHGL